MGKRGHSRGVNKGGRKSGSIVVEKDPDPNNEDYYNDDVDDFHAGRNKVLLDEGYKDRRQLDSDEEEEVLKVISDDDLLSSDDDDDEIRMYRQQLRRFRDHHIQEKMGSDMDDEDEEERGDGLPDSKAWGSKRSKFYHADVIDDKFDLSGSDEDTGNAAMEEKEALEIQKKMAEELDDQDFGLDFFTEKPSKKKEPKVEEEKISKDLSKLSRREKLELLKKESPELLTLIEDYISKLTEARDVYQPLLDLVKGKKICGSAADYVTTRYHLNMNYCVNVSFYLMLKAKHLPAHNHPVVKRLVQYRNLMKQLEPVDEKLRPEMDDILDKLQRGEEVDLSPVIAPEPDEPVISKISEKAVKRKLKERAAKESAPAKKAKKVSGAYETVAEKEALEFYDAMKKTRVEYDDDTSGEEVEEEKEVDEDAADETAEAEEEGKRAITYQIEKNKGMTNKRKKDQRNPRVKHRKKFEKSKTRRKGQVREVRKEMSKYGGELSGIRAGIKRGIKLR